MTIAPLTTSQTTIAGYHRPQGLDAAIYRIGMALVAFANARARREGEPAETLARRSRVLRAVEADYASARGTAASLRGL